MSDRAYSYPEILRFDGRTAIVTGAASGMGLATVHSLSNLGAHVVAVDIDGPGIERIAESLPDVVPVQADVREEESVSRYVATAIERFGRIDAFFNNAGLLGARGPLDETDTESFDLTFDVNVKGSFFGLRSVVGQMVAQGGGGSIVSTASIAGLRGVPGAATYAASKWAVIGMVRSAAKEYGRHGIRLNVICPGMTVTNFSNLGRGENDDAALAQIPLGRLGSADDIADAAVWLMSDAARWITGAVLAVDGGQSA